MVAGKMITGIRQSFFIVSFVISLIIHIIFFIALHFLPGKHETLKIELSDTSVSVSVDDTMEPDQDLTGINNSGTVRDFAENEQRLKLREIGEMWDLLNSPYYSDDAFGNNDFAAARQTMKELNSRKPEIPAGGGTFSTPFDHKLKTETRAMLDDIYSMIGYKEDKNASFRVRMKNFSEFVNRYLNNGKHVRSWKTLWMTAEAPTEDEKIELVSMLYELYLYTQYHSEPDAVEMRETVEEIMDSVPDELKSDLPTELN